RRLRYVSPQFGRMTVGGQSFFFSSRRRHTRCLSDWSSDVCSSDLSSGRRRRAGEDRSARACLRRASPRGSARWHWIPTARTRRQIGRASCRERVQISEVAGAVKKKDKVVGKVTRLKQTSS